MQVNFLRHTEFYEPEKFLICLNIIIPKIRNDRRKKSKSKPIFFAALFFAALILPFLRRERPYFRRKFAYCRS